MSAESGIEGLPDRLRQVRQHLGCTQQGMDQLIGRGDWGHYEAGGSVPGGRVFAALAGLGFNGHWLLLGTGPMRLRTVTADSDLMLADCSQAERAAIRKTLLDRLLSGMLPNATPAELGDALRGEARAFINQRPK